MKSRNGFVSNSSSSSFIVCYNPSEEVCPSCGGRIFPLKESIEIIERNGYTCETVVCETEFDDIIDRIPDDFEFASTPNSPNDIIDRLQACKINHPGWKYLYFKLEYGESIMQREIEIMEESKQLINIIKERD